MTGGGKYKSVLFFASIGLVSSFIVLAQFHENPFRVPVFANIPVCYIYGNAYSAVLLAYLLKDSFLTKILALAGILFGFLVSLYLLLLYVRFSRVGYIFTTEIFGMKTVFTDYMLFTLILLNGLVIRKKKKNG
ncbi:hypothetical protein J6Z19_00180 [bacterium]|nr:hypothetical protein [bacterium]